jgi:RHS repeat-associated protein
VAKYSGSTISAIYLLGLGGEQVTEINGSGTWVHSNLFAGGRLVGTYSGPGASQNPNTWHFHLTDWLGTNRMQTTPAGNNEEQCYSYPFGDGLNCTGPAADATEHHFTGKERDNGSGRDYFFARYYSSDLARFMTPDWAAAPTASLVFQSVIWLGCTSNCSASSASALSPFRAAKATFALKAAV